MGIQIARAAVLLLAAALRLWRLDQNGYDNEYYAAAVRSMASGWHAFLYNAFDPTGFVSVDKPPVALWLQVLAVKLFGFHGLTVLLPQVVEGVAAVALLDFRDNGNRVDPALWRASVSSDDESGGSSTRREARAASGLELYDRKRGAELIPARTDR
jgi:hypothetical protein